MIKLTVEQEFDIASFAQRARMLSREDAHKALADLFRIMVEKETLYKGMLLEGAGIVTPMFEDRNN